MNEQRSLLKYGTKEYNLYVKKLEDARNDLLERLRTIQIELQRCATVELNYWRSRGQVMYTEKEDQKK